MFLFFAGHNIRIDHVSAVSAVWDRGAAQMKDRYQIRVYLCGGQAIDGFWDDQGQAIVAQEAVKKAIGANSH